jgi:cation diffusion facilitator CzcD-associated flavoprotein CzcO
MDFLARPVFTGSRPASTVEPVSHDTRRPTVAVIGAGFGGIGMGIALARAGLTDFTIYEKAADLGGVWRENTYPGAGCDVPSPLYSYSFAPHRTWPRRYSLQPDILAYLRRTAEEYGVTDRIRFGAEVTAAAYDEDTGRWRIETADGAVSHADVLVPAVGQLSRPVWPDLPGAGEFAGPAFHSARWDHDVDLAGKRVAVIGTGASAIQFVPRIQPEVARLTVFQRTAPYVVPKPDRAYGRWHHRVYRAAPATQLAGRLGTWLVGELLNLALTSVRPLARVVDLLFRVHLRAQVRDRALRATLRPDYPIGCKRLLFSNEWYPALTSPNVDLVTAPIEAVTPTGVRTADGVEHPADVLVYGTGFRATDFLAPIDVRGLAGRSLADEWKDGARAYLGVAVPGFPNMFLIYGPNTNLGGSSIIYMMERQTRYVVRLLRALADRPGTGLDVREDVAERFDREVQARLGDSVWSACQSWYRDSGGRISTNWPGPVWEYDRRTRHAGLADYRVLPAS